MIRSTILVRGSNGKGMCRIIFESSAKNCTDFRSRPWRFPLALLFYTCYLYLGNTNFPSLKKKCQPCVTMARSQRAILEDERSSIRCSPCSSPGTAHKSVRRKSWNNVCQLHISPRSLTRSASTSYSSSIFVETLFFITCDW